MSNFVTLTLKMIPLKKKKKKERTFENEWKYTKRNLVLELMPGQSLSSIFTLHVSLSLDFLC